MISLKMIGVEYDTGQGHRNLIIYHITLFVYQFLMLICKLDFQLAEENLKTTIVEITRF